MTEVYMGYECEVAVSITGVEGEATTAISDVTSVEYSNSVEKDEWYAFRNKGKKTSIITGREDSVNVTAKAVKGDEALRYLVKTALTKSGSEAMTKVSVKIPMGFKIEGPATIEVSNPGTSDANTVPDVEVTFTFSGDYTITDLNETE
jgi:hypothetical protein